MDAAGNEHAAGRAGIGDRPPGRERVPQGIRAPVPGRRWDWLVVPALAVAGAAVGFGVSSILVELVLWLGWNVDPWQPGWWRWYFLAGEPLLISFTVVIGTYLWFRYAYRNSRRHADQHADAHADGNPDADSPAHSDSDAQRNA